MHGNTTGRTNYASGELYKDTRHVCNKTAAMQPLTQKDTRWHKCSVLIITKEKTKYKTGNMSYPASSDIHIQRSHNHCYNIHNYITFSFKPTYNSNPPLLFCKDFTSIIQKSLLSKVCLLPLISEENTKLLDVLV